MSREQPLLTTLAKWPRGFGALEGFVATTYEFDRTFFDDEWLPTILEIPTSRRGAGSWFAEVETRLAHLAAAAVLVDAQAFAQGEAVDDPKVNVLRPFSPRVGCYPAVVPGGKLHGKLVVLRFRQGLRMLVGSANLTRSGYRENREIAAVLDWGRQKSPAPRSVASHVLDGLAELADAQQGAASEVNEEITRCRQLLTRLRDGIPAGGIDVSSAWTGLSSSNSAVPDAVLDVWGNSTPPYRIEICSPFWDRNPHASGLSHLRQAWERRFGSSGPPEVLLLTEAEEAGAKLKPISRHGPCSSTRCVVRCVGSRCWRVCSRRSEGQALTTTPG